MHQLQRPCPCGTGATYDACCGQLMRSPDPAIRWTGLRIVAAEGGTVEFVATSQDGRLHEVSRFEQRAGRWVYVEGDVD